MRYIRGKVWARGIPAEMFLFTEKITELLLKNTKNLETILTSASLQIYFSSIIL